MVADRQRSRHPAEDPRVSVDPLRGPGPVVRACRTHARCAQHEGRGPDQVKRSGSISLLPGKARPWLGRCRRLGNGFWGSRVGGSVPGATGRGGTIRPARALPLWHPWQSWRARMAGSSAVGACSPHLLDSNSLWTLPRAAVNSTYLFPVFLLYSSLQS